MHICSVFHLAHLAAVLLCIGRLNSRRSEEELKMKHLDNVIKITEVIKGGWVSVGVGSTQIKKQSMLHINVIPLKD